MGRFLHANPGLESRFNKYFYFEDYNGAQLLAILQSMCAKNGYTLDDKATEYAESYFKTLYEERDENFGTPGTCATYLSGRWPASPTGWPPWRSPARRS